MMFDSVSLVEAIIRLIVQLYTVIRKMWSILGRKRWNIPDHKLYSIPVHTMLSIISHLW